jgi:hypothetical protein
MKKDAAFAPKAASLFLAREPIFQGFTRFEYFLAGLGGILLHGLKDYLIGWRIDHVFKKVAVTIPSN